MNERQKIVMLGLWLLLVAVVFAVSGCETTIGTKYSTRWFYKGDDDPYKSRASGPTSTHGFTAFGKNRQEDK